MKTKSKKFERNIVISHNRDDQQTGGETGTNTSGGTGTNSGKFDWIGGAVTDVTNMLAEIFRKTPSTVNTTNNVTPADNTGLYLGIGAGALVLIVLLVVLLKK